ncbi:hypothetical protein M3650_29195 [Paenibacillus sp. MER TA 81-3]|uniref:hypothetical protein n=1 Tax=Paenibacillus sp. MER TA 81-3 TaxID=2939573 RepID=UPI00203BF38F|nr:hypothetical protein [Paenibacillus sp. MER TA 81-3]MCM3342588.1 hypothetical protein [Paenibacillus sp. MER TA 81-3]
MDITIEGIIAATRHKFGLDNYYLHSHELYRDVNMFNDTIYSLSMEWYPSHITEQEEEGLNPAGTAVIQYDLGARQYKSVIFVQGKSYANGPTYQDISLDEIIKWVAAEAGIVYGEQFQLLKEEEGAFHFNECVDGIPVSPAGHIEIRFDEDGKLVQYSVYGHFPPTSIIQEETYSLSLEDVELLAKKQLQLIEYPVDEEQCLLPLYGIEEIYVTNDGTAAIPFEFIVQARSRLNIDKVIEWELPSTRPFERIDIDQREEVTIEQALACEPHPDTFPITEAEQEKCISAVKEGLRQLYPNDSRQWVLKTLHREKSYIQALLRENKPTKRVFQRKLLLFIDANRHEVINYMDNKPLLSMFDEFQVQGDITVSKDEAYAKLTESIELTPVYVYDPGKKKYVLCGKLDCQYAVNATSGEVVALGSL